MLLIISFAHTGMCVVLHGTLVLFALTKLRFWVIFLPFYFSFALTGTETEGRTQPLIAHGGTAQQRASEWEVHNLGKSSISEWEE